MQNTKAVAAAVATFVIGLAAAFSMRPATAPQAVDQGAPTPIVVKEPAFVGPRAKDKARDDLAALPELRAWFEYLQKESGGTVHGALIEYGPTPKAINGKHYWQFSFVENTPDAAHRWESFLVGQDNADILVEDLDAGTTLTLDQWRKQKDQMARTSAQ